MNLHSERLYGLDPVVDATCQVLIVGSFPSVLSLKAGQYYANPRNDFWKIMEVVTGMPAALSYQSRISFFMNHGIGLWDVVASCSRSGSSDSAIKEPEPNHIGSLISRYPGIRAVFCNGRRADAGLREAMVQEEFSVSRVHTEYLPSSSPAHAIRFEEKCRSWMVLREFIILP